MPQPERIRLHCKDLRLPTMAQVFEQTLTMAQGEDWSLEAFLHFLLEQELAGRRQRRIPRRIKTSPPPPGQTPSRLAMPTAFNAGKFFRGPTLPATK